MLTVALTGLDKYKRLLNLITFFQFNSFLLVQALNASLHDLHPSDGFGDPFARRREQLFAG